MINIIRLDIFHTDVWVKDLPSSECYKAVFCYFCTQNIRSIVSTQVNALYTSAMSVVT